jgi:membrane protease YdiL (CAAX protease family)
VGASLGLSGPKDGVLAALLLSVTLVFAVLAANRSLLVLASVSGVLFNVVSAPPTVLLGATGLIYIVINRGRPSGVVLLRAGMRPAPLFGAMALGAASALFLLAWFAWWSPPQPHIHVSDIASWTPPVAVVAVVLALMNALVEEVFWRGFVSAALLETMTSCRAMILGQGLGFGLMHIQGFPDGWLGVASTTAFGVTAMILTLRSRSIWPAVVAHTVADVTILVQLLAA